MRNRRGFLPNRVWKDSGLTIQDSELRPQRTPDRRLIEESLDKESSKLNQTTLKIQEQEDKNNDLLDLMKRYNVELDVLSTLLNVTSVKLNQTDEKVIQVDQEIGCERLATAIP